MTARELLERAAKAAGYAVHAACQKERDDMGYGHVGLWIPGESTAWNPLVNDGHALRLAVKLYLWDAIRLAHRLVGVPGAPDLYAATRLAIVRAAAALCVD